VSRSFELFQLPFVRTFQQHVRTTLSVRPATGFLSKTQIWEVRCNRPDDVESHPDALIHKASIAFKIQTSGRQTSWSGCASIRYENCVHQINRPDDHFIGPKARSLDMEIAYSESATLQTWLKTGKNFKQILESRSHSCPSGRPMTTIRMTPRFCQARRSVEPTAYK